MFVNVCEHWTGYVCSDLDPTPSGLIGRQNSAEVIDGSTGAAVLCKRLDKCKQKAKKPVTTLRNANQVFYVYSIPGFVLTLVGTDLCQKARITNRTNENKLKTSKKHERF
jgi:hypothetical protein